MRSDTRGFVNARRAQSPSRTQECHAAHLEPVREEALELRMPITFTAFCTTRLPAYIRFATACTGCPRTGRDLTQSALGDLATIWDQALRSASPAAVSWGLISERGSRHARSRGGSAYGVLPRLHADAVVLRYRLGIPAAETAELMGIDELELNGMLRYVARPTAQ